MATVTGLRCIDRDRNPVLCDCFGNNVAFRCLSCGGPVLAIVRDNQRGSSKENPAQCVACESRFYLELDQMQNKLVIYRVA